MQIRKVLALRGPNLWANNFPVLEAWVDLEELKDSPSDTIPGFNDRLMAWLPSMIEHRCSIGERGGFFERLRRGTWMGHILEHVTLELQELASGIPTGFGRARETDEDGVYRVVVRYHEEALGRACLQKGLELCLAAVYDRPFDVQATIEEMRQLAQQVCLKPGTAAIVNAAKARLIPTRRLNDGGLIQLGYGKLQRRLWTAETDQTSAIGQEIASDRDLTRSLLAAVGVPVPYGYPVASAEEAWQAAQDMEAPVAIKPRWEKRGQGVSTNLTTEAEVREAYARAAELGSVYLEQSITGHAYRLLVMNDRLVAAVRTEPGPVVTDVTDRLHPDIASRACDAAKVVGLDIAAIDLVAHDVDRPLEHQGGAVVDVDANPDLSMFVLASSTQPHPVAEAIVDALFPPGQNGRIPVVAVTGVNGKTTTTRLIAHILRQAGKFVGMTCTDGIYLNDRRTVVWDCSGPQSARSVLLNPQVEAAVLETARGGILREGLGFDRSAVSVVTNIGEGDHLGMHLVDTPEQLAYLKRTVVDVVLPDGTAVLKADDPLVAQMAPFCKGSVCFFARDEQHPVITEHRGKGGKALFVRDGMIVRAQGEQEWPLMHVSGVPVTHKGRIAFQVENVLAAVAAAWALAVDDEAVKVALGSFAGDMQQAPGRFNILSVNGGTVILDFGHNPSALEALVDGLGAFPHPRRTLVLSADGDRRDEVITRQAEIVAGAFDHVILYEEPKRNRGRGPGEIIGLLRQGLSTASQPPRITEIQGELAAMRAALDDLQPGELLLILHDAVEKSLTFVRDYLNERSAAGRDVCTAEYPSTRGKPVADGVPAAPLGAIHQAP